MKPLQETFWIMPAGMKGNRKADGLAGLHSAEAGGSPRLTLLPAPIERSENLGGTP